MDRVVLGYHAHVYYNAQTIELARELCRSAAKAFPGVEQGRVWEKPVGPHPAWSCQLACSTQVFPELLPWLVLERGDLTIFAHVLTGDDLFDHTQGVIWLGESVPLNLAIFERGS